jgi:predicted ArsR family transcriptional regulator
MPEATISPVGMKLLKLLVGNPPATISELMDATGVTRTAVTEQLNELFTNGFVDRRLERLPGRGRPRNLYFSTTAALLLLYANCQRLIVPAIWDAISDVGGVGLAKKVAKRLAKMIVEVYKPQITAKSPESRLCQLTDLLNKEGHLIEIVKGDDGRIILRRRSCPLISIFEEKRMVCDVDIDVLSGVIDSPVRRTACRHDGSPCCTFEIVKGKK